MYEGIEKNLYCWESGKTAPPFKIHILPTDACNLKCRSCWRHNCKGDEIPWIKQELNNEELLNLVKQGREIGVREWEISGGGEPLIRRDIIFTMMKNIKKLNMRGDLTTNGTLFSLKSVKFMIDIKWDQINISLDGPNAEINDYLRPPKGTFEKVIFILDLFKKYKKILNSSKPEILISCVLSKANIDCIISMIELAAEFQIKYLGFESIKDFSPLCKPLLLDSKDYKKINQQAQIAVEIAELYGISNNLDSFLKYPELVEKSEEMDGFLKNYTKSNTQTPFLDLLCYEPWYRMMISSIGETAPCCLAKYSAEDNVKNKLLSEIWTGKYFENFRKKILNKNLPFSCKQCTSILVSHSNNIRKKLFELYNEKSKNSRICFDCIHS